MTNPNYKTWLFPAILAARFVHISQWEEYWRSASDEDKQANDPVRYARELEDQG